MSPVECLAWAGGTWMAIAIAAAWVKHRLRRKPPLPQRTPADVHADAAEHRARRLAEIEARANGWHIDDTELADWLAIGTADYRTQCDRHRDAIDQQREEEDR